MTNDIKRELYLTLKDNLYIDENGTVRCEEYLEYTNWYGICLTTDIDSVLESDDVFFFTDISITTSVDYNDMVYGMDQLRNDMEELNTLMMYLMEYIKHNITRMPEDSTPEEMTEKANIAIEEYLN